MSSLSVAIIFFLLGSGVGTLVGWYACRFDRRRPVPEEIARFMDGVVEQEDHDARIRRNQAMLHDSGRRTMPRETGGQATKISKMIIPRTERRK